MDTQEITLMSEDIKQMVKNFKKEVNALIRSVRKDEREFNAKEKKFSKK